MLSNTQNRKQRPSTAPISFLAPTQPSPQPLPSSLSPPPTTDIISAGLSISPKIHSTSSSGPSTPPGSAEQVYGFDSSDSAISSQDEFLSHSTFVVDPTGDGSQVALTSPRAAISPSPSNAAKHKVQEKFVSNQGSFYFSGEKAGQNATSTADTPAGLKAALVCARGVGGRLGTPLGSPYPAPGNDWATGLSASLSAATAATTSRLPQTVFRSSTPGSRFFPPFEVAGSDDSGGGSPVVFEVVKDAADCEEDALCGGSFLADKEIGRGLKGWHGLTLYR